MAFPASGELIPDQRGDGRWMRVTWHPEADVVVLSLWRENGLRRDAAAGAPRGPGPGGGAGRGPGRAAGRRPSRDRREPHTAATDGPRAGGGALVGVLRGTPRAGGAAGRAGRRGVRRLRRAGRRAARSWCCTARSGPPPAWSPTSPPSRSRCRGSAATGWSATAPASRGRSCAPIGLRLGVAESVDDDFAWDEGEGDRTRADWLRGHRGYWQRVCRARGAEFTEDLEVVFERFRVVWPPALADSLTAPTPDRCRPRRSGVDRLGGARGGS